MDSNLPPTNFDEWLIEYQRMKGIVVSQEIREIMRDAYEWGSVQGKWKAIESKVTKFLDSCTKQEINNERNV